LQEEQKSGKAHGREVIGQRQRRLWVMARESVLEKSPGKIEKEESKPHPFEKKKSLQRNGLI